MTIKNGKEEIEYLLTKVLEKYELESGEQITRNSNRKNYEPVAKKLSEISNELPNTAGSLQHRIYPADDNGKNLEYPFRKYDITGNQVKDAYFNHIVSNPRPFLVDSCYIYLYGVGRKGFEENPVDDELICQENELQPYLSSNTDGAAKPGSGKYKPAALQYGWWLAVFFLLLSLLLGYLWMGSESKLTSIQKDMSLLPYQPTRAEIDSLEGVWLCYTGSPQARSSDPHRYHLVVSNVVDVKYKNGYFVFDRYGASFDHTGYMQFESPWLVSIHSHVNNLKDSVESPRHSLMLLNQPGQYLSVISASWNFDFGKKNNIIGIREVYIKQGKGGQLNEILNTIENASCHCKIVRWAQTGKPVKSFYLRNQLLDTLPDSTLSKLLDEHSILPRLPYNQLVLRDSSELKN